ncbi:hypothetical protein [Tenacibaculum insulae]|uniref:hypothetical protein n=1 Tax=Tenacibaculum insulae TaxID=2029677 RepID=UPI003AB72323
MDVVKNCKKRKDINLNQITIPSLNVEKVIRFYQKLGLYLIVDVKSRYVRFEAPKGEATFLIHKEDCLPT